jgi:hypothetical protein
LPKAANEGGAPQLTAPLISLLAYPAGAIDGVLSAVLGVERGKSVFPKLWGLLEWNLLTASGINPEKPGSKMPVPPTKAKDKDGLTLAMEYLGNTPFQEYFQTLVPFSIPFSTRFEHTHILGGSGHGKTQLLQSLILRDLEQLREGKGSLVVIDSQGDMIRTILSQTSLSGMADRVVLIDPNDIEYPPCLNLFDFGLDRLTHYDPVEREKLVNGAIALYEYMFGALLGADLTQRQGVILQSKGFYVEVSQTAFSPDLALAFRWCRDRHDTVGGGISSFVSIDLMNDPAELARQIKQEFRLLGIS